MEHKILKYIKNKINSHSKQKKPSSDAQDLVSLSSKKDIDINEDENMGNYIRYLDGGIANPNNHNIALTGKYGSGKSSIMDSYINDKKLSNFLRVSLASFSNDNHNKFKGKNNEVGSTENIPKGKINNVE
ncbi:YobI family P-loop NTPase, partial [Leuconostoc mesenteroides]